jgi:hypothetical protein
MYESMLLFDSMKKDRRKIPVRVFSSHEEAAKADDEYYAKLSPEERMKELFQLLHTQHIHAGRIKRVVKKYPLGKG